jgi:glycosyltransferase involved in cell wall biosynthesis
MSQETRRSTLHTLILSYGVVEEGGGPSVAAAGFAAGLSQLGVRVTLIALDRQGRWLVDGRTGGYEFVRLRSERGPKALVEMVRSSWRSLQPRERAVAWVNGIWGPASLAARTLRIAGLPYVVRPAGSLGHAALRYRPWRKRAYYDLIEGPIAKGASSVHCMSEREVAELPDELRGRAFVVPTGVDIFETPPSVLAEPSGPPILGVLARLHPIKRHSVVLDAIEALVAAGKDVRVEFAGDASDLAYGASLAHRIAQSPMLRDRVKLLGHVPAKEVPALVGRWRVALLLSEQENFGHAVVAAASAGVPSLVSPGVGVGAQLESAGAGRVVRDDEVVQAIVSELSTSDSNRAERCRNYALRHSWSAVSAALRDHLEHAARPLGR